MNNQNGLMKLPRIQRSYFSVSQNLKAVLNIKFFFRGKIQN